MEFAIGLFKLHDLSLKKNRLVTVLFLISTIFIFTQVSKMKIIFSAEDLAGPDLPIAVELKDLRERFQDGVTSTFLLRPQVGRSDFTIDELCRIRDWYSTIRVSIPELKMSSSTFDFKWPVQTSPTRVSSRNILDLDCQNRVLRTPIELVKNQLNQTPFGLARDLSQNLTLVFQFVFHDSITSKFGPFNPETVNALRKSVEQELLPKLNSSEARWVGPADYQWYLLEGFKFAKWVNLGMLLLVLIVLKLFLGTWRSGLIYCGTLFVTAIWVFGLKGLFGSSFDVLSTGLFLLIGISSMEDFVFISGELMKGYSWRKALRKIMVPGCFTSITTVIGFLASCVSDLEAIRRMGFWTGLGGLIECAMIFFILPAVLKTFSFKSTWVRPNSLYKYLQSITNKTMPRYLAYALCVVFPLSLIMVGSFDYNESPQNIFPQNQEYRVSLEDLKNSKEWLGVASLIFDQPLSYKEVDSIMNQLKTDKWIKNFVVSFESPQGVIDWIDNLKVLPSDIAEVQFNISLLKDVFVDENNYVRSLLYVKETSVDSIGYLKTKTNEICSGRCHLSGEVVAYSDFAGLIPRSMIESLFASLFFVSLIIIYLALALDKEKDLWALLISSFWAPFFMIMVIGFLPITIDFWKSIFASILVGLAGDNAIQYIEASRRKTLNKAIADRGASSILTVGLMSVTALCYLGSYFSSPKTFGLILSAGLLASLVGELWLLNSLLTSKDKE